MLGLKLSEAGESDLADIAGLATLIWNQHYPEIIGQAQVDYMLQMMYSAESLREQLLAKHHRFFLIRSGSEKIGFISMHKENNDNWYLNKFYVDQQSIYRGAGSRIFKEIVNLLQPEKITLTVNRANYKSINFYFKMGFKISGLVKMDIGNGFVMDDFVMEWKRT
jgi:ribosomal protein S18 acetylase RimI-like enzyme